MRFPIPPRRPQTLGNQNGVAMLMAITTMLILGVLAAELVYDTEVYHRMVFNQVDELRAKTLAKSGLKLAILQLQAKQKALAKANSLGLSSGDANSLADRIWQTPLVLPPPIPPGLGPIEKETLETFNKSLSLEGRIAVTINGESSKLNLNQLVWANTGTGTGTSSNTAVNGGAPPPAQPNSTTPEQAMEATQNTFIAVLNQLLVNKKQANEAFRTKYQAVTADILVPNLLAWMSPAVPDDGNRVPKGEYYSRASPEPYSPKEAPLCSLSELHMVKGYDDEIFQLVADNFTTLITSGVNINQAPVSLLRGLIPLLNEEDAAKLDKRRTDPTLGGPFASVQDFWTYLSTLGNYQEAQKALDSSGITLTTDETSYRVSVIASSGNAQKSWVAMIGATPPNTPSTSSPQTPLPTPPLASTNTSTATNGNQVPSVIYLKAD